MKLILLMLSITPVIGLSQEWRTFKTENMLDDGLDVLNFRAAKYNSYDSSMWFVGYHGADGELLQMKYDGSYNFYNLYELNGWDEFYHALRAIDFIEDDVYVLDAEYGFFKFKDGVTTMIYDFVKDGLEIIKTENDTLFLCTDDYDNKGYYTYKDGAIADSSSSNSALPHNQVGQVLTDESNRTWFIGYNWAADAGGGLFRYEDNDWTPYFPWNSNLNHNSSTELFQIPEGDLIASTKGGLAVFDEAELDWVMYDMTNTNLPSEDLRAVEIDSEGRIWVSIHGVGIAYTANYTDWVIFDETNSPLYTGTHLFAIDEFDNVWTYGTGARIHAVNINSIEGWLSNDELELNSEIQVYPNPSTDFVQINSAELIERVEIYNISGEMVLNTNNMDTPTMVNLNLQSFDKGVYLIKVYSKGEFITKKITIQ